MGRLALLVNDDGISSHGLKAAVRALEDIADVLVCAPSEQQSGVGRSISLFTPVPISRGMVEGVEAYAVGGTPVDAVIVGVYGLAYKKPDLVVSGINLGENLSFEATTSGTVGAALEAANQDIPAISISVHSEERVKFEYLQPEQDFCTSENVLRAIAREALEQGMPHGAHVLNVNVPMDTRDSTIAVTSLAKRMYTTKVHRRRDPRGRPYFWIDGDAVEDAPEGTDVHAVRVKNQVSITPLNLDLTSAGSIEKTKEIAGRVERELKK